MSATRDLIQGPVVKTPASNAGGLGSRVQSLMRELRFLMPQGITRKVNLQTNKSKQTNPISNKIKVLKITGGVCARVLSHFSRVWLVTTLRTVAHQAPLPMGFSRQEHWSGLPCPSLGDLPDPGIESASHYVSCIGRQVSTSATWEVPWGSYQI